MLLQLRAAHHLLDARPDAGEADADALVAQVLGQVFEHVDRRRVQRHHGRHLDHNVLHTALEAGAKLVCEARDGVLDVGHVGKVHARPHAEHEDAADELACGLALLDVAVDGRPRQLPEHGDLGPHALAQHNDERDADGDGEADFDSQEENAEEGDEPQAKVPLAHLVQLDRLAELDEVDDARDDDGGQNEFRQLPGHVGEDQ
mmetsp:Transcript_13360/g.44695  ORF Transcript_13360/g.44695 Transcript_13360/m.44695 type:complete len:203 (+) Transcript_13360:1074-1682(+)